MISVEEKLKVFTQYLLKKERSWGKDIVNEAKEKRLELIEASEIKMKDDKHTIEERSYHIIFRDKNKTIAEGKNKAKTRELEEKNKILVDFNDLILKKAIEYIGSNTYQEYLKGCIEKIPSVFKEKKNLTIFLNPNEENEIKNMVENTLIDYSIQYQNQKDKMIGGLIVQDNDNRIHCDFSVDNLIKSNYKLIGMTLNDFMKVQGN
ncbi:MAG: V-type ATP synthase subunit E [Eubacteriaceae bacterium]